MKSQQARVHNFLDEQVFLNWDCIMPAFKLPLLHRIIEFYDSKQQVLKDVDLIVQFSVSDKLLSVLHLHDIGCFFTHVFLFFPISLFCAVYLEF